MTAALATVAVTAVIAVAVLAWLREELVSLLWTAAGGVFVGALLYLEWADPWTGYVYAGVVAASLVWQFLPERDDGDETVPERLVGMIWRVPAYWLALVFFAFLFALVGALAVFLVIGLPIGWVDLLTHENCKNELLGLGGCQPAVGKEVEEPSFLDDNFDVLGVGAGIALAVAALLVGFGMPDFFGLSDEDEESPPNRFERLGWVGVGVAAVTVVLAIGVIVASWFDSGEFTGGPAASPAAGETEVEGGDSGIDPTPERLDGSSSQEFESSDIARAERASEAVREYCSGAVSEAQEVGCLSHVDESEIP